ncbi:MAG: hypothetical protein HY200_04485 [Nitrospirae bacterium]|nr:hypothetical protein [Nitrospirota bacterium]
MILSYQILMVLIRFAFMTLFLVNFAGLAHINSSYAADVMSESEYKNTHSVPGPSKPLFGVSADATYFTRYIWHGFDYSDQKPVLQPEMILSLRNDPFTEKSERNCLAQL